MRKICFIFALIGLLESIAFGQEQINDSIGTMKVLKKNIGDRKIIMTRLNKKETKEIIAAFHGKENLKISKQVSCQAYVLNDGRLVLSHEGGGMMYESVKDLEDLRSYQEKNFKPHPFFDGLPYGVYYLTHIDTIINEFSVKIGISLAELDKSIESLIKIEKRLKEMKLDAEQIEKDYLVYIVTYSGEVIRNKVGGNWALRELTIDNKLVYEPYILTENDREYTPLWGYYEELIEHPERLSIAVTIEAEIGKYALYDMMLKDKK